MRLSTHLSISHAVPVLMVTLALGLSLIALVRIGMVLTTLNDAELEALRDEGTLHRQAWTLDVAMRHAHNACTTGHASTEPIRRVKVEADALRRLIPSAAPGPMRTLAEGYRETAAAVVQGDACQNLLNERLQGRRAELDESLTNVWVDRLSVLHTAVAQKEREANRIAVTATWVGMPLAVASLLLAMTTARRMAKIVTQPLTTLSAMAQRFGRGDFQGSITVHGPSEVLAFANELENMRKHLQQLDSLKQGFLASVSHELRTPLSKIRESLALMEDGAVGSFEARQMRVIHIARSACERQIRLVTTLLDLSRLRAGSPIRLRDGASIDNVLHAALEDESSEASQRGVEIELATEGEAPPCQIDPVLVERAIANLVRNGVAVSKKGQRVRVERFVETARADRPGAWARIMVHDQGPGVPPEIRDKLFDAFVTQPVPSSGKTLGIGLGLALAREVAKAHGGDLELGESASSGTTFQLWLPLDLGKRAQSTSQAPFAALASPGQIGARA